MRVLDSHLIDGNSPLVPLPVLSAAQALPHLGVKHAHLQRRNPSRPARTCATQRGRRRQAGCRSTSQGRAFRQQNVQKA